MNIYTVSIIETIAHKFKVEAESREEAERKAEELLTKYNNGDIFSSPIEGEQLEIFAQVD